jgi:hypothetical protein
LIFKKEINQQPATKPLIEQPNKNLPTPIARIHLRDRVILVVLFSPPKIPIAITPSPKKSDRSSPLNSLHQQILRAPIERIHLRDRVGECVRLSFLIGRKNALETKSQSSNQAASTRNHAEESLSLVAVGPMSESLGIDPRLVH